MKAIGLILILAVAQSCFYRPYAKDEEWWYLEDWDTNNDWTIDKNEFITGFKEHKMIKKISPKAQPVAYADFDSLVTKISRSAGEHIKDKAKASSLDVDGDQKLSEAELAAAMFVIADDNKDNKLSGLEFYEWEVYYQ
jgi:hypothetical protein